MENLLAALGWWMLAEGKKELPGIDPIDDGFIRRFWGGDEQPAIPKRGSWLH